MSDVYEFDPLNPNVPALQESGRKEATLAFVRSMVWYLETMTERGRPYKDGRRPYIKLRRFCPGIPYASVRAVLDALTDINVITDPVISGHIEPGKWRATFTHYRKDSRYERVDAKDATATIFQDLVPFYEDGEGEELDGGGDCKRKRSYTYVWEAASIETPPRPYPVGVSYAIQNVQRSDETGLFDYVLVREESIEIHEEPYVSRRAAGVVQKTERWYNAREIPEGLPKEGESFDEQGRLVEVSIQKNDDCTYDIVVQTTETEEYEAKEACAITVTQHEHSVTRAGQDEPLGEAPAAGGGIYYRHSSDKESDGTYTNTVVTVCEIPLPEQQVQKSKTLDGTRVTTAHKNLAAVPAADLSVGESLAFSVNDGGSYDVTITCFELCDEMFIGRSSCKTISAEIDTKTEVRPEQGIETATVDEGTMVAISYCQTDLGTWRRFESTIVETPVEDKRVSKSMTLDGVVIRTSHQHQPKGTDCEVKNIGDHVVVERTDGDLVDLEVQQLDRSSFQERILSETTQADMFSESHAQTCSSLVALTCVGGIGAIKKAGGGTIYRAASCMTEAGTYRNTESVACELPQEDAVVTTDVAVGKTRIRKEGRNLPEMAELGGELGTVSNGLTEGGVYNTVVVTTELTPEEWAYKRSQSVFEDVTMCHYAGFDDITKESNNDKDVVMVDRDMQDGGYTTVVQHTEPKHAWAARGGAEDFDTISCSGQDRNCGNSFYGDLGAAPVVEYKDGEVITYCSMQTGITGFYNVGWTITKAKEFWYEESSFAGRCSTEYIFNFANSKDYIPTQARQLIASIDKSKLLSVSPSVSRDRFGNWNGVISVRTLTADSGGGGSQFVDEFEEEFPVSYARMYSTSDGSQAEEIWEAEYVYGYDKSIGSANNKVRDNHEAVATNACSSWKPFVNMRRDPGGERAQWAADYGYYKNVKKKKNVILRSDKCGSTNTNVTVDEGVCSGNNSCSSCSSCSSYSQ